MSWAKFATRPVSPLSKSFVVSERVPSSKPWNILIEFKTAERVVDRIAFDRKKVHFDGFVGCCVRNGNAKTDQNAEKLDDISVGDGVQTADDFEKGQIFIFNTYAQIYNRFINNA